MNRRNLFSFLAGAAAFVAPLFSSRTTLPQPNASPALVDAILEVLGDNLAIAMVRCGGWSPVTVDDLRLAVERRSLATHWMPLPEKPA